MTLEQLFKPFEWLQASGNGFFWKDSEQGNSKIIPYRATSLASNQAHNPTVGTARLDPKQRISENQKSLSLAMAPFPWKERLQQKAAQERQEQFDRAWSDRTQF